MSRSRKLVDIETAKFTLDGPLRAWLADKFPTINPDLTLEVFTDKALSKGWVYVSWPAAFRNYVRKSKDWGGVVYFDHLNKPEFAASLTFAKAIGFRMPHSYENGRTYRAALQAFDRTHAKAQVNIPMPLKRIPKK